MIKLGWCMVRQAKKGWKSYIGASGGDPHPN